MHENKTCSGCKQTKTKNEFGFQNVEKKQLKSLCKDCDKKRQKAYYLANREKDKQYKAKKYQDNKAEYLLKSKQYRKNNPEKVKISQENYLSKNPDIQKINARNRKARIKSGSNYLVRKSDIRKILSQPCIYCGSRENIQIEHVVPISRGGQHSIGNIAPACAKCNNQKNKWFISEWKLLQMKWGVSF